MIKQSRLKIILILHYIAILQSVNKLHVSCSSPSLPKISEYQYDIYLKL